MTDNTHTLIAVIDAVDALPAKYRIQDPVDVGARVRRFYAHQQMPLSEDLLCEAMTREETKAVAVQPGPPRSFIHADQMSLRVALGLFIVGVVYFISMAHQFSSPVANAHPASIAAIAQEPATAFMGYVPFDASLQGPAYQSPPLTGSALSATPLEFQ